MSFINFENEIVQEIKGSGVDLIKTSDCNGYFYELTLATSFAQGTVTFSDSAASTIKEIAKNNNLDAKFNSSKNLFWVTPK